MNVCSTYPGTDVLPSLVAGEEEEVFVWEDENPSTSVLASNSEQPNSDPTEESGHFSSVEHQDDGQPQLELFPLAIVLPETSLAQDIFTSSALVQMGFPDNFLTAPALSQPIPQMSLTRTTRRLTPVRPADNRGGPSGSKVPEWTGRGSERGRRSGRPSTVVVPGCTFPCFGAGVIAPFRNLPRRLLVLAQSHVHWQ